MRVKLHRLVEDDLPLRERSTDAVCDRVYLTAVDIYKLPEIMPLGWVREVLAKFEIIDTVEALYLYLLFYRLSGKAHFHPPFPKCTKRTK